MSRLFLAAGLAVLSLTACSTAPKSEFKRETLLEKADETIALFKKADPSLEDYFFSTAEGYAVFPTIGKGAAGLGGAYGRGALFVRNQPTAFCDVTQASFGLQLGGQAYSEIIFFQTQDALESFRQGSFEFSAQVSAVAATAYASADASYTYGVAVFTIAGKGLMYEASVGGQRFSCTPIAYR